MSAKRSFSLNFSSWKAICQQRDSFARASVPGKQYVKKQLLQPGLQFLESISSERDFSARASVPESITSETALSSRASVPRKHYVRKQLLHPTFFGNTTLEKSGSAG
jgi:hypothetical protein